MDEYKQFESKSEDETLRPATHSNYIQGVAAPYVLREEENYSVHIGEIALISNLTNIVTAAACLICTCYMLDTTYPSYREKSLWILTWFCGVENAKYPAKIKIFIEDLQRKARST